jgi:hypothetical protein
MFRIKFLRDGDNQILGDETRFDNGDVIARDRDGKVLAGPATHSATPATVMASL